MNDAIFGMSLAQASIIIPTGATLIVFILGWLFSIISKNYREWERKQNVRKSIFNWIDVLSSPINNAIQNLANFADACTNNRMLQQPGFIWNPLMGDKIERVIDSTAIYAFLNDGHERSIQQSVYNLIIQSRFIAELEIHVKNKYQEFETESRKLMDEWNNIYIKLQAEIGSLLKHTLHDGDPLFRFLYSLKTYHDNECSQHEGDFVTAYSTLIEQLLRPEILRDFSERQEYIEIEKNANLACIIHKRWVALNNGYYRIFTDFATSLTHSRDFIYSAITHLRSNFDPSQYCPF